MCHLSDAGHIGGKLNDQRPLRKAFCRRDHFIQRSGITTELNPAMLRVRAGNIEFIRCNAFPFVQNLDCVFIVLPRVSEYIGDHNCVLDLAKLGQLLLDEGASTDVLKPNRIEHPGSGFVEARRRIANDRLARKPLYNESAKPIQMNYVLEFDPVAKRTTRRDDRVLKLDAGQADCKIWSHEGVLTLRVFRGSFIANASLHAAKASPNTISTGGSLGGLRLIIAAFLFSALMLALWFGFHTSDLATSLGGRYPRAFASFVLLLA